MEGAGSYFASVRHSVVSTLGEYVSQDFDESSLPVTLPTETRRLDFYQGLRARIRAWLDTPRGRRFRYAEYLLIAPDLFHVLCKLAMDERVPHEQRLKLAMAAAYFIAPFDFMAELMLGPIGFLDDIALAAFVLDQMMNETPPALVQEHWAGDGDVLQHVRNIIASARKMIGGRLFNRLRGFGKIRKKPTA